MKFYLCEYAGKSDIFCTYTNDGWFGKFFVSDNNTYICDSSGNVTNIIIEKRKKQILLVYPQDLTIIKELQLSEVPKKLVKIFTKLNNEQKAIGY